MAYLCYVTFIIYTSNIITFVWSYEQQASGSVKLENEIMTSFLCDYECNITLKRQNYRVTSHLKVTGSIGALLGLDRLSMLEREIRRKSPIHSSFCNNK